MVRIIASAHTLVGDQNGPQGWCQRLEWPEDQRRARCVVVLPLLRDGIGEAVKSMGYRVADLARRVDILGALDRLTEGDPLLVRLYAESLWKNAGASQRIGLEELEKLDPGYVGFFKDWFAKQRGNWSDSNSPFRKQLEAVLAVLSLALGPIEHRHLEAICGIVFHDRAFSLSSKDIEPIQRFLIGDGIGIGYTFQHPKFAQYFKDEYFKNGLYQPQRKRLRHGAKIPLMN